MKEYDSIRKKLTDRFSEIQERLGKIVGETQHLQGEALNPDFAEQAVERENDEVLDALDQSIRLELLQIKESLKRLDEGEYGTCASCGRNIPVKRLEALPFATRCVECAAA